MDRAEVLLAARALCADATGRVTALLRPRPHLDVPIGNGSTWSVRDAAVHAIVAGNVYSELAAGVPSPYAALSREAIAATNEHLAADVAETDPDKVADLVEHSVRAFLDGTRGWSGDREVLFHGGTPIDLAALTTILAAESLLHGYDMARALGVPWALTRTDALLILDCYLPSVPSVIDAEAAAGLTAGCAIAARGAGRWTLRFADGVCTLDAEDGEVDCTLWVDPAAFLLALSGRMAPWPAFALGLFTVEGSRPELGAGFFDLLRFP